MPDRYPGYDVLAKRNTPSWNEQTRRGDRRAAGRRPDAPRFFTDARMADAATRSATASCRSRRTRRAGSARRHDRRRSCIDERRRRLSRRRHAAACARPGGAACAALDAEARRAPRPRFHDAGARRAGCAADADAARRRCSDAAWGGMPPQAFFSQARAARHRQRLLRASRPPGTRSASAARPARAAMCGWISTGAIPGKRPKRSPATKHERGGRTPVSDDPRRRPARARRPRARRVPSRRLGADARISPTTRRSISPSSAPAPAAARSPASWPKHGFSVVALDAGPYWRPLEDFASDETRAGEALLDRRAHRRRRRSAAARRATIQRQVGRRLTVHFAMVSLRFRPGVVQVAQPARLRRRLAARLARDVALLRARSSRR